VSTVLTALVVSVPVVSGAGGAAPLVGLESLASTSVTRSTHGDSPVVMGRDGRPDSSATFAGASTTPDEAGGSSTDAVAGPASTAPVTTGSAPSTVGAVAAAGAPASATAPGTTPAPPVVAEAPAPKPQPQPGPEAPAPAVVPAALGAEEQVLALVNAQRAAVGCGALAGDASLASVARAHSADMRDRGFFDHVNPDGLDPFDRAERAGLSARGENIARTGGEHRLWAAGRRRGHGRMDEQRGSPGQHPELPPDPSGRRRGRRSRWPLVDPALRLRLINSRSIGISTQMRPPRTGC
jgi:uncharacterized protein YkwD